VAETPKPLLEVAGAPFLLHQLKLLAANGARHAVLCVGYLGGKIEERIGRTQFGISIDYSYDSPGLDGTLGAIRRALAHLPDEFLVLYGDAYLDLDYGAAVESWARSGCAGLMTVFRNEGRWGMSNVVFHDGRVTAYDKESPTREMKWIDYGLSGLRAETLSLGPEEATDLGAVYSALAVRGELHGYEVHRRFYEIGSPTSLAETEAFLRRRQDKEYGRSETT
jgi:NDP-sugar pyrophosphorylase family protein